MSYAAAPLTARTTERAAWLALVSAGLAWLFDAMDLQIFTLILFPCISDLIGSTDVARVTQIGGLVVACKLVAWGVGGIVFGVVADHIGRARTMLITVLIYACFTALSGLAQTWPQLAATQALAGIGMGGEWAAGAALVAETWPERSRARAMQLMQLCFALGFFAAAALNFVIGPFGWRWVFAAGVAPAPIIVLLRTFVPESARWSAAHHAQAAADPQFHRPTAPLRAILSRDMRRRTIVGVLITLAMMLGTNSLSPLTSPWVHTLLPHGQQAATGRVVSKFFMLYSIGGVIGYLALTWPNDRLPRRLAYSLIVLGAAAVTLAQFCFVTTAADLLRFAPIIGFFCVGGFGFFAVYLPELFRTAIRATGQGFCWNLARLLTALGPAIAGTLVGALGSIPAAGRAVAAFFVIGLVAIWFGPETKGWPLPD